MMYDENSMTEQRRRLVDQVSPESKAITDAIRKNDTEVATHMEALRQLLIVARSRVGQ